MRFIMFVLASLWALASVALAHAEVLPETSGVITPRAAVPASRQMVVAAHPLAAQAGLDILRAGGSAVDAAIAAQLVLNVVEPQSSGIGGGGFLLSYSAADGNIAAYDGRETAPLQAKREDFYGADAMPKPFEERVQGGLAVGTPGLPALLWEAHARSGSLPWEQLFAPAIRIAREGFPATARMHDNAALAPYLQKFSESKALYWTPDGPVAPGTLITNPALADTLERLAKEGITPFYQGDIGRDLVAAVRRSPVNPGRLSEEDLKHYQVKRYSALCRPYKAVRICGMPPPSSGGVTVLQTLGMLEFFALPPYNPDNTLQLHSITEATRLAFADRNYYLADPAFAPQPVDALLDTHYLMSRAESIDEDTAMIGVEPGVIPAVSPAPSPITIEPPSTTHISVVDAAGNAVALTSSIEHGFGSGITVRGFLLNNQLTDFTLTPADAANRLEPGKRPRSSMSPVMVFDRENKLSLVLGSPGGARIIPYVLQSLLAVLDGGYDIQQAVSLPHHGDVGSGLELEAGTPLEAQAELLRAMGHEVNLSAQPSGLHGIQRTPTGWLGGADPRRDGVALGD